MTENNSLISKTIACGSFNVSVKWSVEHKTQLRLHSFRLEFHLLRISPLLCVINYIIMSRFPGLGQLIARISCKWTFFSERFIFLFWMIQLIIQHRFNVLLKCKIEYKYSTFWKRFIEFAYRLTKSKLISHIESPLDPAKHILTQLS